VAAIEVIAGSRRAHATMPQRTSKPTANEGIWGYATAPSSARRHSMNERPMR